MAEAAPSRSPAATAKPARAGIRALCVLPRLHDARIARRIDMLKAGGFAVEAVAFERDYDAGHAADCPVQVVGRLRNFRYLARIATLLKAVPSVRRAIRRNHVVYAFNTDIGALAVLAGLGLPAKVAVEVADIVEAQVAGGFGRVVRALERLALARSALLVLTTAGYLPYYRRRLGVETPALVVENKLDVAFAQSIRPAGTPPPADPPNDRPLRIGWFGVLREPWSLNVLDALTRQAPERFTALLAGSFDNRMTALGVDEHSFEQAVDNPNIQYLGGYRSPEDLARLYAQVDLVMDCYRTTVPHCWSQTNKFYEACLFAKPLITRAGCGDAQAISRHGLGVVLSASTPEDAARELAQLTLADWRRWRANAAALPLPTYALIDEVPALAKALGALARSGRETPGTAPTP